MVTLEGKEVPFISVVVPTCNRRELLARCLRALLAQQYPRYEVIVVDDASTDGTEVMVQEAFPQVRYLRQTTRRGPAAARNRGIQVARGEIVAFTDDDCEPPPDWLATLWEGFQRYPDVGAVGGIQVAPPEVLRRRVLARYESFLTRRVYGVATAPVIGTPAPGGTNNLAVPIAVLRRVGGFDEHFPVAAGEDADLLYRIAGLGYRTVCLPVPVFHHQAYTWRVFVRQQFRRGVGAAYFLRKWGRWPSLVREVFRFWGTPLLYLRDVMRYRAPLMVLIHHLAGLLQLGGRLWARWRWQQEVMPQAWRQAPSPVKLRYVRRYVVGHTVLDVGVGRGFYARVLQARGYRVVGVDLYPEPEGEVPVVQARLCALPFGTPFDTVLAFDVLEHEPDERRALAELRRLTRRRLVLSVPNADHGRLPLYNLTYKHHVDPTHCRTYTAKAIQARLEEAGFRVLAVHLEGPVSPAVLAEFVRPAFLREGVRVLLKALHRWRVLYNPSLMADVYVVAEPRHTS